jgi:hypothetical protein
VIWQKTAPKRMRPVIAVSRRAPSAMVVVLAAAACGSSSSGAAPKTVPPGRYHDTVCGSIGRYSRATAQPFLVFQGLHLQFTYGIPKRSAVRDKQIAASLSIVEATDQLIAGLRAAGVPRTAHGQAFADELLSAFHELHDSIDHVHDQAVSLPTGSGRADPDSELSPQIGAALEQLGKRLDSDRTTNGAGLDLHCGTS